MRFLKRNQFLLIFVATLIFCSVIVIRQFLANEWGHVDLLEDFIVLHDTGKTRGEERLYQMLVQELPGLPSRVLIADKQQLTLQFSTNKPPPEDLVWKYYISVQNELKSRTDERVAQALKRAGSE